MNYNVPGSLILLTVILAVLKLMNYVAFPWLWIFSPIWLPWVLEVLLRIISYCSRVTGISKH